jgi:hypothetical protein
MGYEQEREYDEQVPDTLGMIHDSNRDTNPHDNTKATLTRAITF